MNLSKIHHIAIIVSDYEAAKNFYVNRMSGSDPMKYTQMMETLRCSTSRTVSPPSTPSLMSQSSSSSEKSLIFRYNAQGGIVA